MDLRMSEMSGVEAIIAIREEDDKASVIILTTYDSDEDVYRGMRAGAKAYLLKDAHREELLNCIRAVYAGKTVVSPKVAAKLASRLREEELTPRELEILNLGLGHARCVKGWTILKIVKIVVTTEVL